MVTHTFHVLVIVIVTDVRYVTNSMTTFKYLIKATGIVQVCGVKGQPAGSKRTHFLKEISSHRVVCISHAGADPIALFEE